MPSWLTVDIGGKDGKSGGGFDFSLKGELVETEKSLIRAAVGILMITAVYIGISTFLVTQMNDKIGEVTIQADKVVKQEAAVQTDKTKVDAKTSQYVELVQSLQAKTQVDTENKRLKYSVPTLLSKIMYSIPQNAQLTSILNSGTKIVITAQSDKYEPLGIFIAKLGNDGILKNVVSDTSKKQNDVVVVTIEGELP